MSLWGLLDCFLVIFSRLGAGLGELGQPTESEHSDAQMIPASSVFVCHEPNGHSQVSPRPGVAQSAFHQVSHLMACCVPREYEIIGGSDEIM